MLGHAAGSITSRYIRHLDSVLISAADNVAAKVHEMMVVQPEEAWSDAAVDTKYLHSEADVRLVPVHKRQAVEFI
jgi:hypothetical protein